jgi:glycosyltransferase involved in cell wall biosynthesis
MTGVRRQNGLVVKEGFMNDRALVSAIVPTYNRGYIVGNAIESILSQTYDKVEVIVVDDGSTDNTQEKLKEYGDRIRVVYQKNSGPSAARNRGIELSRGEIIAFLDSDDIWLPTKLERQVSILERTPASVPCCLCNGIQRRTSGGEYRSFDMALIKLQCDEGLWLNVADVLATRFVLFCQLAAIRREALVKAGGFDESLRFMEDYDLELRLSLDGPWAVIREPLAIMTSNTWDGLSLSVSKEEVCHAQYALRTCERVVAMAKSRTQPITGIGYFKQSIKKARRDLWGARLRESSSWGARTVGKLHKGMERYRMAVFRRSPWFPRVKVVPIDFGKSLPVAFYGRKTSNQPSAP